MDIDSLQLNILKWRNEQQGCILRSKQDLEDEALLRDYGQAA